LEFNDPFQHKYGYIRDEHQSTEGKYTTLHEITNNQQSGYVWLFKQNYRMKKGLQEVHMATKKVCNCQPS